MADILIVEANEKLAQRFALLLQKQGYTTQIVKNFDAAASSISNTIPSLLLMKIKKDEPQIVSDEGHTPIIAYTDGVKVLADLVINVEKLLTGDIFQKRVRN